MDHLRERKYVLVITDSRGSWLHRELRPHQRPYLKFNVIYKRGAGLSKLWEIAERAIFTRKVDLILIMGGVCDMTDKFYVNGVRKFWPPDDMEQRFREISATLKDMAHNFKLMAPKCKLAFLPDPGLDLIRVNKILHPVPWRALIIQSELEENLETLHLYTRVLNSYLGALTPWTLEITHSHRRGTMIPVYDRTYDGIHFSREQITKLADEIARYALNEI